MRAYMRPRVRHHNTPALAAATEPAIGPMTTATLLSGATVLARTAWTWTGISRCACLATGCSITLIDGRRLGDMQLETAVRRHLLHDDKIAELAGRRVFKYGPRPDQQVDRTGNLMLVVTRVGGWATPDPVNTQRFPVVRVAATADPSRTPSGEIAVEDADDRAGGLQLVLDRLLHGRRGWWCGATGRDSGLYVISSARWADQVRPVTPRSYPTPAGDTVTVHYDYAFQI